MGTLNEDLSAIKEVEDKIIANKVARFAYTEEAYAKNIADGVPMYNVNNAQNIPTADPSVLKVNDTVLSQGYRAQASSITRMLVNHFLGRLSYNVNKVNDGFSNLVATLIKHRGTANGFATLDENGRIPYSQLPESAAGDVKTVNNISPENGNIPLTGENIPVSSTDPTLLSAPLTTDRYADSSVTTEKIADNAVTNAKIKDPISVAKGGTGETTGTKACNSLLKSLETGTSVPIDTDTFISQYAGGSAIDETSPDKNNYYRRPVSALWEYIKSKISSVLGLTATQYNGNAKTATTATNANNAYRGMVHTCTTDAGTASKTVSITGFTLTTGACIKVVFTQGNKTSRPTLNVNNTGAKEIKIINFKNEYYTESSLDDTNGFYIWKPWISLDLYYNGSCWIVLDNPVVYDNTGYSTSPQYRICIDSYKEIRGSYYYGNISDGKDINHTIYLPLTLVDPDHCHVSLSVRHSAEAYLNSGEEMSYYLDFDKLIIHFYNRNESADMQGVSFDYMIFGY